MFESLLQKKKIRPDSDLATISISPSAVRKLVSRISKPNFVLTNSLAAAYPALPMPGGKLSFPLVVLNFVLLRIDIQT